MIERYEYSLIIESLRRFPAVGVLGARQTGKTTIAKLIAENPGFEYLDLENPSHLSRLADPVMYFESRKNNTVILDETQRMPELFPVIRSMIDRNPEQMGQFLLLGSASPDLLRQSSESLAGRIIYHELHPLSLRELESVEVSMHWLRGGFPRAFLGGNDESCMEWLESFIRTFLERDLGQLNYRLPAMQMRRFWTMLAHCQGQLFNSSRLASSLAVSSPTTSRWLDVLCDTYMVRQLQPWFANAGKRLVKSSKVYLRDSGIVHRLLGIENHDELLSHPVCGSSWEGYVIEQISSVIPRRTEMYHYRTKNGAEIDLLLKVPGHNKLIAVEIKRSSAPRVERGFWNAFNDLECERGFVVYPGDESWPVGQGVMALPVKQLEKICE